MDIKKKIQENQQLSALCKFYDKNYEDKHFGLDKNDYCSLFSTNTEIGDFLIEKDRIKYIQRHLQKRTK